MFENWSYGELLSKLQEAVQENRILPYYQPIVRNLTNKTAALESLARWIRNDGTVVQPGGFIPALEEKHLIHLLDLAMLDRIREDHLKARSLGVRLPLISVNLSRLDFEDCDLVEEIKRRRDRWKEIDEDITKHICFEVTESIYSKDPESIREQLGKLKEMGFEIWLDDFGSGYSSLEILTRDDFDLIKMDQSIIRGLTDESKNSVIVTAITDMARNLHLGSLAEGIEDHACFSLAKEIGVEFMQGYWISRPIPLEQLVMKQSDAGTMLEFEDPDSRSFYDTIGKINLRSPFGGTVANPAKWRDNILPAGVIGVKGNSYRLICCTWSFFEAMQLLELLPEQVGDEIEIPFLREMDPEFRKAVRSCFETGAWEAYSFNYKGKVPVTGRVKELSEDPVQHMKAVITVFFSEKMIPFLSGAEE